MKARLLQQIHGPAVATIGSWDPILPAHWRLFGRLGRHASKSSLASLVILLEPPPPLFLKGSMRWPRYDDLRARVALIRSSGVQAVLLVRFSADDLALGAAELFDLVRCHVQVNELWLGSMQSLGRGLPGSQATIAELAAERGIRLSLLSPPRNGLVGSRVRDLLQEGRVREATRIVDRPPLWGRPRGGALRLAWAPGWYEVAPLETVPSHRRGPPLRVELVADRKGLPKLTWPDDAIPWLAFLRGPGDDPDASLAQPGRSRPSVEDWPSARSHRIAGS